MTFAAFLVCCSPSLARTATAAMTRRLTDESIATYNRMEQFAKDGADAAAIREARRFLASIPRPHAADAFGEKYRQALRTLMDSAEAAGDQAQRLHAGELALAFDPNDSVLLFNYGRALAAAGQVDQSITLLEAAFRIRPTSPQILHTLEAQLAAASPGRIREMRQRHLEALALCMTLPTWMSGNLTASDASQAKGFDLHLSLDRETTITGPVGFTPNAVYLVLPRLPELEVRIKSAHLFGARGEAVVLNPEPQLNLFRLSDGFVRITPPDTAGFDDATAIGFKLPAEIPADARIEVRVECRASPAVASVLRVFGTWQHPGVKMVTTD